MPPFVFHLSHIFSKRSLQILNYVIYFTINSITHVTLTLEIAFMNLRKGAEFAKRLHKEPYHYYTTKAKNNILIFGELFGIMSIRR